MDKRTQQSILNTVNSIVNKNNIVENLATVFEHNLNVFEKLFQITLTEQQESDLVECAIYHFRSNQKTKQVNLNEDIEIIIENNSPEEVFISLCEAGPVAIAASLLPAAAQAASSLMGGGGKPPPESTGGLWTVLSNIRQEGQQKLNSPSTVGLEKLPDEITRPEQLVGEDGTEEEEIPDEELSPEERRIKLQAAQNPSENDKKILKAYREMSIEDMLAHTQPQIIINPRGYVAEESNMILKKKKKKVFKIIFVDKGVKKKGTAVSHKGVARIISGKSNYKVFDEKNNDVTSQFKAKRHKKHDQK